ncbi:hypothetical protein ACVME8_010781 [Bradyrhizobium diazoefficiens]
MSDVSAPRDLTRWNRAGLSRFAYIDGNAAVWLDEVRLSMLARFIRDVSGEVRTEDYWRDLFQRALAPQDIADAQAYAGKLVWKTLLEPLPAKPETTRLRNERLLALYARRSPDQAHEIMRAFARAAHVLLGHVDAYANEGYLRTATQWDSMRKLCAMIGYQPTPAAAASTVVALIVEPGTQSVEVERGVPMSFTPPGGGKPVIFETVETFDAHSSLNAARAHGYDRNEQPLCTSGYNRFVLPRGAQPKIGDVVLLVADSGGNVPFPAVVNQASILKDGQLADISLETPLTQSWPKYLSCLLAKPDKVLKARPRSFQLMVVVEIANTALFQAGGAVFYTDSSGQDRIAGVVSVADGRVVLQPEPGSTLSGNVQLTLANQYHAPGAQAMTAPGVEAVWFKTGSAFSKIAKADAAIDKVDDKEIDIRFSKPAGGGAIAYAKSGGSSAHVAARVVAEPPAVLSSGGSGSRSSTVEFSGKPSPKLVNGSWFVARKDGGSPALTAHKVVGIRVTPDSHFVVFDPAPASSDSTVEFHGPMTLTLRPEDHDRGQEPVFSGGILLTGLERDAQKLVKVGRKIVVEDERDGGGPPVLLTIATVLAGAGNLDEIKVTFTESPAQLDGLITGWTVFRLNTSRATHGETRGAKTLGSGNAERLRQTFGLAVKDVTFTPSSAAESGVAPDIDVAVQDVVWDYRDLNDPTAEGTDSWSVGLREDDTLDILFRRRLPTGNNNVVVKRHRVGTGPAGNVVPAYGFTKPSKKHRFVVAVVQAFATSGGSEREPVSSMLQSAPSRLSANGRAVSLKDFEKLASRHASVWQARAVRLSEVGASIRLIVVAAYGGAVGQAFKDVLSDFIRQRAIPDMRLQIEGFVAVPVHILATVRVELARYDKNDVVEASIAALVDAFSLRRRALGQSFLIGEILAALEKVDGVETAVATLTLDAGAPVMTRSPLSFPGGGLSAIYPDVGQVAYLPDASFVTVLAEAV